MHVIWKRRDKWFQAYLGAELMGEYKKRADEPVFDVRCYAPGKRLSTAQDLAAARRAVEEHITAFWCRALAAGFVSPADPDAHLPLWEVSALHLPAPVRVRARDANHARAKAIERHLYAVPTSMGIKRIDE